MASLADRPASTATGNGGRYDAIVVGGGHNGLTAGAYLARAGLRTCVRERRHVLGGRLRHRGGLARPSGLARELRRLPCSPPEGRRPTWELKRLRLRGAPARPGLRDLRRPTARPSSTTTRARTRESLRRLSPHDADRYEGFEALLERMADFVRPLMHRPPPALGSKRPGDLLSLLREAGRAAGLSGREAQDALPGDDASRSPTSSTTGSSRT